ANPIDGQALYAADCGSVRTGRYVGSVDGGPSPEFDVSSRRKLRVYLENLGLARYFSGRIRGPSVS
ncbi:MAG: hypothetical protein ACKO9Q_11525, partial [Pirellula sp.]